MCRFLKLCLLVCALAPAYARDLEPALDTAIETLSRSYIKDKNLVMRKNLAVAEFTALTPELKAEGHHATVREMAISRLANSAVFVVVERESVDKLLREQAFQLTGATQQQDAVRLGNLLNAHAFLTGTLAESAGDVRLVLKLIDVETGKVYAHEEVIERSSILVSRERLEDMAYLQKYGVGISIHFLSHIFGGANPGLPIGDKPQNTWILRPFGAEVKYRFTRHFTAGLGMSMVIGSFKYFDSYPYATQMYSDTAPIYQGGKLSLQSEGTPGFSVPLIFYGVYPFSRRFNVFTFLGVEPMLLNNVSAQMEPKGALAAGPEVDLRYRGYNYKWKTEIIALHLGAGVEYYVSPRLALSLRAHYTWAQADLRTQPKNITVDMSGFGFSPAVSLYF